MRRHRPPAIAIPDRPVPRGLLREREEQERPLREVFSLVVTLKERLEEAVGLIDAGKPEAARELLDGVVTALDEMPLGPLRPPERPS